MKQYDFNDNWIYHKDGSDETQNITLPYDAMIHDERRADSKTGSACAWFVGGKYIYEKSFDVPEDWAKRHVEMDFGGVYKNASVYLNDELIAFRPYGYVPFSADMDAALLPGKTNVIRVEADNTEVPNSRWYSGGGIYRRVGLSVSETKTYIPLDGVKVNTLRTEVPTVSFAIELAGEKVDNIRAEIMVLDGKSVLGKAVSDDLTQPLVMELPSAKLWSEEDPKLYRYEAALYAQCAEAGSEKEGSQRLLDIAGGTIGIRSLSWNHTGFYVNGKRTLFKGACIHHDNGVVGAAEIPELADRKIRILKENGYNAIRMAHHPASEEVLNACDRYGVFVMDETFDMWYDKKNPYDYALDFEEWHDRDIEAMVRKDYNHPSVVMYSIGNEVGEPGQPEGVAKAREMIEQIHSLDHSRAVTEGTNLMLIYMTSLGKGLYAEGGLASAKSESSAPKDVSAEEAKRAKSAKESKEKEKASGSLLFNQLASSMGKIFNKMIELPMPGKAGEPMLKELDIAGMNYAMGRYAGDHKKHPDWALLGSETYACDIYKAWKLTKKIPALIGDFMWTGWDYIGEAAIGAWNYEGTSMMNVAYPWLLADTGAIDITGHPGAEAHYARIVWEAAEGRKVTPYMGVRPANQKQSDLIKAAWRWTNAIDSWSWSDCEGNETIVEVYGKGAYVRLFLNSREIGKRRLKELKCRFRVAYEPGKLQARIYDEDDQFLDSVELRSAAFDSDGRPEILIEQEEIFGFKNSDICVYNISLVGDNGIVESNMDQVLKLNISGGELLGFGSAAPKTSCSFDSGEYRTYYGRAIAVVRKTASEVRLNAAGEYVKVK